MGEGITMGDRTSIAELATRLRADQYFYQFGKQYTIDDAAAKFQVSLDLKNSLDRLERAYYGESPEGQARQLIIYEYALYDLNKANTVQTSRPEGIRTHPFLSHWVEVIRRARLWSQIPAHHTDHTQSSRTGQANGRNGRSGMWIATQIRCTIITMILTGDHAFLETLAGLSLDDLFEDSDQWIGWPLDLQPYLTMLLEEDVYSREDILAPLPFPGLENLRPESITTGSAQALTKEQREAGYDQDTKRAVPRADDVLDIVTHAPQAAWSLLTSLDMDIPVLELLNELFSNQKFTTQLDAADLASAIIQNALRSIEPPEATDNQISSRRPPDLLGSNDSRAQRSGPSSNQDDGRQLKKILDRGERIRVVKLLVLFIKHIIRTGIASPGIILYEIQEITTRYAWVGEVRELQSWVQGGDLLDDTVEKTFDGGASGQARGRSLRGLGG